MTTIDTAPVIAHVVRGAFTEGVHHGLAVVTAPDGAVVTALGDPRTPVFPRSSLKPAQAVGIVRAGAPLAGAALALACASHSGEQAHLDGVRAMLAAARLDPGALRNTSDLPLGEDARAAWLAAGRGPEPLAQNCSGKHAGMLSACVAAGWSVDGYLDPDHPLQRSLRATVEELAGEAASDVAVDGCGAPLFALSLAGLARAVGRIAGASDGPERRVADAMRAHPHLVGGTGRPDTQLMERAPGLLAKQGAEGVLVVGLSDGTGVAVKVADGAERAARVAAAALLAGLGVPARATGPLGDVPVLGHGERVGAVVPAPTLVG